MMDGEGILSYDASNLSREGLWSDDASNSSWTDVDDENYDEIKTEAIKRDTYCNQSLLMNSLVLEKIFEFLPLKDLQTCRLVCKEWNKTALLRKLLGAKVKITITKRNFDRLLKTAHNSFHPFCRSFKFWTMELDFEKVTKFMEYFGERLSSLSLSSVVEKTFNISSSTESVIKVLDCPRLEELTIYGSLPEIQEENFLPTIFTRLKKISIDSSVDFGQVKRDFIGVILRRAPNLQSVEIGGSTISLWKDFCSELTSNLSPKLSQIKFLGTCISRSNDCMLDFLSKGLIPRRIFFHNCIMTSNFLEQLILQTFQHLSILHIEGIEDQSYEQEILTKAFTFVTLPNLRELFLPVAGIGISEGANILQSCPNIQILKVSGLFQTTYRFQDKQLLSVSVREVVRSSMFPINNIDENQREFLKVLSLVDLQPKKLEVNLPDSNRSCKVLRAIYRKYPNLVDLCLVHKSVRECLVLLTGIPYHRCKQLANCRSFSVLSPNKLIFFPSISKLKYLKRLELTMVEESPNAELTLILFVYGICGLKNLKELALNNFTITDVSLIILAQRLHLSICKMNGSEKEWKRFQSFYQQHTVKSFLLPPPPSGDQNCSTSDDAMKSLMMNPQILLKVFDNLDHSDIFEARKVCTYWHTLASEYLHRQCSIDLAGQLEMRLNHYNRERSHPPTLNRSLYYTTHFQQLKQRQLFYLPKILQIWSSVCSNNETSLAIVTLNNSTLETLQIENANLIAFNRNLACQQRKMLEYLYYPDGTDEIVNQSNQSDSFKKDINDKSKWETVLHNITTLLAIGCWGNRKDQGLLEFLNPSGNIKTIYLVGLEKDTLDTVLPKLTQIVSLESLYIKPLMNTSSYCDLTKTHLQILCNAAFKLKMLTMHFHEPSNAIVDFVRSQRFTLESLELKSLVNISDCLTFSMPQLQVLHLDEPPGCLLWTILNVHSGLKTISFGRNGSVCNQAKNKSSLKMNALEADFEHFATEIVCDVNWFLENAVSRDRNGVKKSILQQGSDSPLKFFMHFPNLSSLTLRGVFAQYGLLEKIFKRFSHQLKKLELVNATGVTDEILTGFSKKILSEMDTMNPFKVKRDRHVTETQRKGKASIRNLKCLTHLTLDDQPSCTDFSVIFGILKLRQLQFFSCKKWKITDISIRALADTLPSLRQLNTDDCSKVSRDALKYFKQSKTLYRTLCSISDVIVDRQ